MKRTAFNRKTPQWQDKSKQWSGPEIKPRRPVLRVVQRDVGPRTPIPKVKPLRDERYRRWVAKQSCCHCHRPGPSQCAHADVGKGMGTKTSDQTCYALCVACHLGIGSEGWYSKDDRRSREAEYGEQTRDRARREGVYPDGWP